MSSTPARGRRWTHGLGSVGLLALVIFPWASAGISLEDRLRYYFLLPVISMVETLGLIYTATFLVIFIHESGHWFFGRLVGIRISKFVVGTGSPQLQFTRHGVQFFFGAWLRWGYVTEVPARANLHFGKQLIFLAGGVVAEIIFLAALYLIPTSLVPAYAFSYDPVAYTFSRLRWFALVSGGIGIWASVWPRQASIEGRLTPNDALLIQQAWRKRGKEDETWQHLEWSDEVVALCRAGKNAEAAVILERMLQSDPQNTGLMEVLASTHVAVGNWDRARALHHEVIQRTEPRTPERAHAVDAAATLALQLGHRDELATLRPLVEEAVQASAMPTLIGTLGSILIELDETVAGVKRLNQCLAESDAPHDHAIANAYLAKAALRLGQKQRATELLGFAKAKCAEHPLVMRLVKELEPELLSMTESG